MDVVYLHSNLLYSVIQKNKIWMTLVVLMLLRLSPLKSSALINVRENQEKKNA